MLRAPRAIFALPYPGTRAFAALATLASLRPAYGAPKTLCLCLCSTLPPLSSPHLPFTLFALSPLRPLFRPSIFQLIAVVHKFRRRSKGKTGKERFRKQAHQGKLEGVLDEREACSRKAMHNRN